MSDDTPFVPSIPGTLRRPWRLEGFFSWVTTVDHKRIGIMYGITAFMWFLVGGSEALLIRLQLARPNGQVLNANLYNEVFTMHGTTMVFMVVMPLASAFFNYLTPLMIGARDVAFPRLNALSYWVFLAGSLFIYSSFFLGGAPNGGWFGYAPNSSVKFSPGHNLDFWLWGLLIMGVASTVGSINLITAIFNMRAPGMKLMRMPIFIWMTLITTLLTLFAVPVITVALVLLMFDRSFGSNFFNPDAGGDPILWQHLFWIFGHPEVYILILPAMGIISEILPVFSRKPLFGYRIMVFSGASIGFLGWGVWAHHMFATGMGPLSVSAFSITTMTIAIPTGVKIFNWIFTLWQGSIQYRVAMMYAVGFIAMFTIGGLSGVTHSVAADDRQQTDTYYIVAHFHYVIFGGALFGLMAGLYYWWPKVFGYALNERFGKVQFWFWFIGFNLTFAPMHMLGIDGMPRRIYTYSEGSGWEMWNMVSSIGALTLGLAAVMFGVVVRYSKRRAMREQGIIDNFPYWKIAGAVTVLPVFFGVIRQWNMAGMSLMFAACVWLLLMFEGISHRGLKAPNDPWDARTIEWMISSPPPVENFSFTPHVEHLDEFWHRKYAEDENGRLVALPEDRRPVYADEVPDAHIHLPSPSYYPLLVAATLPIIAYGMVFSRDTTFAWYVTAIGVVLLLGSLYAWVLEASVDEEPGLGDVEGVTERALIRAELEAKKAAELVAVGSASEAAGELGTGDASSGAASGDVDGEGK